MNDYPFKLAKVEAELVWHDHPATDEVFCVIDGIRNIKFRDGTVTLEPGEMFVTPEGVEHKPVTVNECKIMLVGPKGVITPVIPAQT